MTQGTLSEPRVATYNDLRLINVSDHIEKKNGLSYLSWAWAVDQLLQQDPSATWEYREGTEYARMTEEKVVEYTVPYLRIRDTAMVFCTVHAFGVSRTAQLPVMDHRNKPIPEPDSFQLNTAMQRCLAKAIALHGIGLYIYNGEDLPPDEPKAPEPTLTAEQINAARDALNGAKTVEELVAAFNGLGAELQAATREFATALKKKLKAAA